MTIRPEIVAAYREPMKRLIVAAAVKSAKLYPAEEAFQAHLELLGLRRELEIRRLSYAPGPNATIYGGKQAEMEAR